MIDALETAERAAAAAEADEAEAVVLAERSGFARFAASEVHQPTLVEDATVSLRVVRDGKVGIAATNDLADEGLRRLARRAAESADSAPAEESFPGLADPAKRASPERSLCTSTIASSPSAAASARSARSSA